MQGWQQGCADLHMPGMWQAKAGPAASPLSLPRVQRQRRCDGTYGRLLHPAANCGAAASSRHPPAAQRPVWQRCRQQLPGRRRRLDSGAASRGRLSCAASRGLGQPRLRLPPTRSDVAPGPISSWLCASLPPAKQRARSGMQVSRMQALLSPDTSACGCTSHVLVLPLSRPHVRPVRPRMVCCHVCLQAPTTSRGLHPTHRDTALAWAPAAPLRWGLAPAYLAAWCSPMP